MVKTVYCVFKTWEAQRITNRSKKVVETLRPKIYKGASLNELRHVLQVMFYTDIPLQAHV